MPVSHREQPDFSPYGRYALNVKERAEPGPTLFHDTYNASSCGIEEVPTGNLSRFNNKKWAIQRGFTPCLHCM